MTDGWRMHKSAASEWARLSSRCWKQTWVVLTAVIREVFDESAYARFLARARVSPSAQAYAAFRREHETQKAIKPRCC
jgi:hypothetical protein